MNILTKYKEEVKPKLKEEFGIKNDLALPQMEKIVLNMGVAEAITSHDILEKVKMKLIKFPLI